MALSFRSKLIGCLVLAFAMIVAFGIGYRAGHRHHLAAAPTMASVQTTTASNVFRNIP